MNDFTNEKWAGNKVFRKNKFPNKTGRFFFLKPPFDKLNRAFQRSFGRKYGGYLPGHSNIVTAKPAIGF
jgi:hypothetical protein